MLADSARDFRRQRTFRGSANIFHNPHNASLNPKNVSIFHVLCCFFHYLFLRNRRRIQFRFFAAIEKAKFEIDLMLIKYFSWCALPVEVFVENDHRFVRHHPVTTFEKTNGNERLHICYNCSFVQAEQSAQMTRGVRVFLIIKLKKYCKRYSVHLIETIEMESGEKLLF